MHYEMILKDFQAELEAEGRSKVRLEFLLW